MWHGYITGEGLVNKSLYTLDVRKQENGVITGRAYLYSTRLFIFQGLFDFVGTVQRNQVKITELRLLDQQIADKFYLCIKYENLQFHKDSAEYLNGVWGNSKGKCPPGKVYLQRVKAGKEGDLIPAAVLAKITTDHSGNITFLNTQLARPQVLNVKQPSIQITIKDYLKEDNDTVSVYLNRQEIIKNHEISHRPYTKKVRLDVLSGMNEVVVYAKNLGRIPPNTCTLIVYDGFSRQKVSIMSDKQNSAAIYLNFVAPDGVLYRVIENRAESRSSNPKP